MATTESIKKELEKTRGKAPETIADRVRLYKNQISKALPSVLTPERFSRMVLTALTKTPKLQTCRPDTFVGAMLTAAQLGLEPNTPLGQAYLIPYKNNKKEIIECQFQIGYKGLIDLAYRSGEYQCIMAEVVYENDKFDFEYGLEPKLEHKPALADRGRAKWVYALYKLKNGGYSFKVMSIDDVVKYAKKYSKSYSDGPWQTNLEAMAKKTALKQLLKYAPMKTELAGAVTADGSVSTIDFSQEDENGAPLIVSDFEVENENENAAVAVDEETGEVLND